MAWFATWLEGVRGSVLDGILQELLADFLPWFFVALLAYVTKSLLKKCWDWWIQASIWKKIMGLAALLVAFAGASFVFMAGLRWWREYVKPVQYVSTEVSFYAGEEEFSSNFAEINHPEYIDADGIDTVYVWDSGEIHELMGYREGTYGLGGYNVDALHVRKGDLYVLTTPWRDGSLYADGEHFDYRFTVLRVRGEGAGNVTDIMDEPFFAGTDWMEIRFTDFLISNKGDTLWLARQDVGQGTVILERILRDGDSEGFSSGEMEWFADLQYDVTDNNKPRLAMDEKGNLFISAPEDHEILRFNFEKGEDSFKIFAGDEHKEGSHRDGPNPRFINPTSIAVKGDYLYVYDSGAVRRVSLSNGSAVTMAGKALPNGEGDSPFPNRAQPKVSGAEAVLPCGQYPGMAVLDNGTVLLCNRENGVIYRIVERRDS